MSTVIKFSAIQKIVQEHPFVYAEVTDQAGNLAIAGNSGKVKVKDWLRLKVAPLVAKWPNAGIYLFKFYTDKQKKALPHVYAVQLGDATLNENGNGQNGQMIHIHTPSPVLNEADKVLSYPEVLKLQNELAQLKAENGFLKGGGKLNEPGDEEEEEEEEEETLAEKTGGIFKSIAEGVIPVLDHFAKARDRETQLKWAEFTVKNPMYAAYSPYKMPVPGQPEPQNTHGGEHPLIAVCDEWLTANEENIEPEAYEKIMDMSEECNTFEEWCQKMHATYPDVYKEMYTHVTNLKNNEPTKQV